jgi:Flp pilus assembly protein TadD
MASATDEVPALLREAQRALHAGRPEDAENLARAALSQAPQNADALTLHAAALQSLGRTAEAREALETLTLWQPQVAAHWVNLGTVCRAERSYEEALVAYRQADALGERSASFYYNVGLLQLDRCDLTAAEAALARARELAPDDAEIGYHHAQCCQARLDTDAALVALDGWEHWQGLTPDLLAKLALLFTKLGDVARATQALGRIAAAARSEPGTALVLLQVYERLNRLEEAEALLPNLQAPAANVLSRTDVLAAEGLLAQRRGDHARASVLLTSAAEACEEPHLRHHALFRLAKSLDALGDYSAAMRTLIDAHASQVALLKLTAPTAVARTSMRVAAHGSSRDDVARWDEREAPSAAQSPIFIVGFPRSGTTLLEQALDAHPDLRSMDEQPFLQKILDRLLAAGVPYAEGLAGLTAAQLADARAHYWQQVSRRVRLAPSQRLVDKNPLNMMALPLIRRLFPRAPLLLALRHPCDVLLSCYQQHFGAPEFALLCADLDQLAIGYDDAFSFWYEEVEVLKPKVLELRYESFVRDFPAQLRGVSDFLELPWNDAVLRPAERARAKGFVSTPSYTQVIQPVNDRSVGRWHHYAPWFDAALPRLTPWLRRFGYAADAGPPVASV